MELKFPYRIRLPEQTSRITANDNDGIQFHPRRVHCTKGTPTFKAGV